MSKGLAKAEIVRAALETLERALRCGDIVALARLDDGGAVSAREMAERRACLRDLDRAARRALVAVCSDSLEPR